MKSRNREHIAYLDTCAGDHVWRLDSGRQYLSNLIEQRGKSVVGITGHKKELTHSGEDKLVLGDRINLGNVVNNLTSIPKILDKGGSMYGNNKGCVIWDKDKKVIIRGTRGKNRMYEY